ncbi:hypothetical protein H5410_000325 [Solanum commersonii]|uniref:Uncharacterized protein n=1 Tax=Solanum commersonii TaxID=4109 RepID=A0A9J6AVT7_SOLCO|nr:hypothetical protein H5410_000325 [Solanum commersonii]
MLFPALKGCCKSAAFSGLSKVQKLSNFGPFKATAVAASFQSTWKRLTRRESNAREWESKSDSNEENSCEVNKEKELDV